MCIKHETSRDVKVASHNHTKSICTSSHYHRLDTQWYTPWDEFFILSYGDVENPYRIPNNGWNGAPRQLKRGHVLPNN